MPILLLMTLSASALLESVRWSLPAFGVCVVVGALVNLLGVQMNFLVWIHVSVLIRCVYRWKSVGVQPTNMWSMAETAGSGRATPCDTSRI
jgi:hypothetical protein